MEFTRRALILFCAWVLTSTVSKAAEGADLVQLVESLRAAMQTKDKVQLEMLCHDQLSYGHSSGKIDDKSGFIAGATSTKWHWISLDFLDPSTKIAGDLAISRTTLAGVYEVDGGKQISIKDGVVMVWRRESGQWKLIVRQAYKI
jgi:ketosteroid isomerase-like protein